MGLTPSNMSLLLNKLKEVTQTGAPNVVNSADTWAQIGKGAKFDELGFESEDALKDWISQNPYSNI